MIILTKRWFLIEDINGEIEILKSDTSRTKLEKFAVSDEYINRNLSIINRNIFRNKYPVQYENWFNKYKK